MLDDLNKALLYAIKNRDDNKTQVLINALNSCIELFEDNKEFHSFNFNLLHELCSDKSKIKDLDYLLSFKLNIHILNEEEDDPVVTAIANDNKDALNALLDYDKKINLLKVTVDEKPLLFFIAESFNVKTLKVYVEDYDLDIHQTYFSEDMDAEVNVFQYIIHDTAKGAILNIAENYKGYGDTTSRKKDFFSKLDYFLESGIDIDDVDIDSGSWTALHYSSLYNNKSIIKYLIDNGADINRLTKEGVEHTPIEIAHNQNNHETEDLLKEYKENEEIRNAAKSRRYKKETKFKI